MMLSSPSILRHTVMAIIREINETHVINNGVEGFIVVVTPANVETAKIVDSNTVERNTHID